MSPADKLSSRKQSKEKRNLFVTIFRACFGCALKKNSSNVNVKENATVSCQCTDDLKSTYSIEETTLLESRACLDVTLVNDDEIRPLAENFQSSLNKLDNLINKLNNIHNLCKNNSLIALNEKYIRETDTEKGINSNKEYDEEVLKFNVTFNNNTFIQCYTTKGKHSLRVINDNDRQVTNPVIHRCESEFLLTKNFYKSKNISTRHEMKNRTSSEINQTKSNQLQRSYHTLSNQFGSHNFNLLVFKSNLIEHMKNIKNDVNILRNVLYGVKHIMKEDNLFLGLNFEEIKKWFIGDQNKTACDVQCSKRLLRIEDFKFVKAKIRATNFCRFYVLRRKYKVKTNIQTEREKRI